MAVAVDATLGADGVGAVDEVGVGVAALVMSARGAGAIGSLLALLA